MAKVLIRYLTGAGTHRDRTGEVSPQWATAVDNRKDKQIHSLVLSPVYHPTPRTVAKTWDEFLNLEAPAEISIPGKKGIMICEEENVLPLSCTQLSQKEQEQVSLNARKNIWAEGKQKARARAAELDMAFQGAALVMITVALAFVVIVFGVLLLLQRLG